MSILAFVVNPSSSFEQRFRVAVAAEDVYRRFWLPAATKLQTHLILRFECGVELGQEDFAELVKELSQLNAELQSATPSELRVEIGQRIELLIAKLGELYEQDPKARVFIG